MPSATTDRILLFTSVGRVRRRLLCGEEPADPAQPLPDAGFDQPGIFAKGQNHVSRGLWHYAPAGVLGDQVGPGTERSQRGRPRRSPRASTWRLTATRVIPGYCHKARNSFHPRPPLPANLRTPVPYREPGAIVMKARLAGRRINHPTSPRARRGNTTMQTLCSGRVRRAEEEGSRSA